MLVILVVVFLAPAALFGLLWMYLRRVAPAGGVPEPEIDAAPAPRTRVESVTEKAMPCPRCHLLVRPAIKGYETAECPNCGAPLFVAPRLMT